MNNYQNYSMDEIIFENRNKTYGAYQLRQSMDRHASVGLLITVTAFSVLMLIYKLSAFDNYDTTVSGPIINIKPIDFKNPVAEIPKTKPVSVQSPPPRVNTDMFKDFHVVQNVQVPQTVPQQADLGNNPIGETDIKDAAPSTNNVPSEVTSANGTGSTPVIETPAITTTSILSTSQVLPDFPNGKEALMKYLQNNIHPYSSDIDKGGFGKVIIRFYVDTDGSVRNPEVIRDGIGGRCAEAAINVIKKMPKWKPGMQNGVPVKVYFTLPVSFDFTHNY